MTEKISPAYDLAELIRHCGEEGRVIVLREAVVTAFDDFGLEDEDAVRQFVCDGGMLEPEYITTCPYEQNPNPKIEMLVDSYTFSTGKILGYLAFYRGPTNKWLIKSFKKNLKQGSGQGALTHSPFAGLLGRPKP